MRGRRLKCLLLLYVGKTVISANLGVALAQLDKEVTILDPDIETPSLLLRLGLGEAKTTLHDVLAGEASPSEAAYEGPNGVKVIPIGISLEGLRKADRGRVEQVLDELLKTTEILIIDSPRGLGRSAITSLAIGQELLLVLNPEISSMSDALKTKIIGRRLGMDVIGAVLNRAGYDKTDLTVQEVETILECCVLAVVSEDPEVERSLSIGQPIVARVPGSSAAVAIKKLAIDLVEEDYIAPKPPKESFKKRLIEGLFGEG